MAFGPGHLDGTPRPGEPGNAVVSGHRDTHFAFLRRLREGDAILVERPDGVVRRLPRERRAGRGPAGDLGRVGRLRRHAADPRHLLPVRRRSGRAGPLRYVVTARLADAARVRYPYGSAAGEDAARRAAGRRSSPCMDRRPPPDEPLASPDRSRRARCRRPRSRPRRMPPRCLAHAARADPRRRRMPSLPPEPTGPADPAVAKAVSDVIGSARHPELKWPDVRDVAPTMKALYDAEPDGLFWFAGAEPYPGVRRRRRAAAARRVRARARPRRLRRGRPREALGGRALAVARPRSGRCSTSA